MGKINTMNKMGKTSTLTILLVVMVVALVGLGTFMVYQTQQTAVPVVLDNTAGSGASNANVAVNPAASYSTVDAFTAATVTGASTYYKLGAVADANGGLTGGQAVTTTAFSNVNPGTSYGYWVSNATAYYVQPLVQTAGTLNNLFQNRKAYANTTSPIALAGYDTTNRQTITDDAYNTTLAANGIANEEISYQGVAKRSNIPFGGIMAVEVNSTITSVSCTGPGVGANSGRFHLTYTPTNVNTKAWLFEVDKTFDVGDAALRRINCQFQNGATAIGLGVLKVNMYPANYYVANDGNIYLDTEKFANSGDSTRTGLGGITALSAHFS